MTHEAVLTELLEKTLETIRATDSGRDVASLVARAADLSRELDALSNEAGVEAATASKIDEIRKRREAKKRGA